MSEPYIGEIRMFAGNFAPNGWAFCEGQTLPIAENDALFAVIGTTYGGDGASTFNLPNLASRIPMHMGFDAVNGATYTIGQMGGTEQETLTTQQIPAHSHQLFGSQDVATANSPANAVFAATTGATTLGYGTDNPQLAMHPSSVSSVGGSQPHDNTQPFLCVNFIISLFGIFPQQS